MTTTHALVIRTTPTYANGRRTFRTLAEFNSFALAAIAYEAIVPVLGEVETLNNFAVRAAGDPMVAPSRQTGEMRALGIHEAVHTATRKAVEKEVRETLKWVIESIIRREAPGSFFNIAAEAFNSLIARGYNVTRFSVEDTLKSMSTIGRCHGCGQGRTAYFFLRSSRATLAHVRCPKCNDRLAQTTLALRATFTLIPDPIATYWDVTPKFLPGESQAQREARAERIHEAIEREFAEQA